MMGFLSARQIRVFDYPRFAEPLRDRVRARAAELASAAGVTIEHIAKKHIRTWRYVRQRGRNSQRIPSNISRITARERQHGNRTRG
jgi:hypothetical protein